MPSVRSLVEWELARNLFGVQPAAGLIVPAAREGDFGRAGHLAFSASTLAQIERCARQFCFAERRGVKAGGSAFATAIASDEGRKAGLGRHIASAESGELMPASDLILVRAAQAGRYLRELRSATS